MNSTRNHLRTEWYDCVYLKKKRAANLLSFREQSRIPSTFLLWTIHFRCAFHACDALQFSSRFSLRHYIVLKIYCCRRIVKKEGRKKANQWTYHGTEVHAGILSKLLISKFSPCYISAYSFFHQVISIHLRIYAQCTYTIQCKLFSVTPTRSESF